METVQFPFEINGDWDNALFLTYSIDFAFFEKAIWGLLGQQCNNIVILADERNYLKAQDLAENDELKVEMFFKLADVYLETDEWRKYYLKKQLFIGHWTSDCMLI